MPVRALARRCWNSAVVWSWAFSGLRMASNLLLLPFLDLLSRPDFGFNGMLVMLANLVPLLDLGFLNAIDRAISYAMGGATELKAQGLPSRAADGAKPNFELLWKLLHTTRSLYRYLAIGVLVVLGIVGTWVVNAKVHETSQPQLSWMAWGLTLAGAGFEMYSGWWNVYLRGLNQVLLCSRILALSFFIKVTLAATLLACGAGIISVPIATVVSSLVQRTLSKWFSLRFLRGHPSPVIRREEITSLLATLWPNSWRIGLLLLSGWGYSSIVSAMFFGLATTGEYMLSTTVAGACQTMATIWVGVKWPLVGQLRARHDFEGLRRLLWPRLWLQMLTYAAVAIAAFTLGPTLLKWAHIDKKLLPPAWLALLLANAFLETLLSSWTTLLNMENRTPALWPIIITNMATLGLVLVLTRFTQLGVGALVLAPFINGCLFNYWFWPIAGARSLETTWIRFTFSRPTRQSS